VGLGHRHIQGVGALLVIEVEVVVVVVVRVSASSASPPLTTWRCLGYFAPLLAPLIVRATMWSSLHRKIVPMPKQRGNQSTK